MELITTYSKKIFPLYLSPLVIDKITEWCRNFPNNEWSGVIFYTTKGSMQDDTFEIHCKDFYVQNIGTSTYTEYDENAYSLNYADEHDLLDCYTGTIHSHNTMGAFFSSTDDTTLKERSKDMPHFLSVIVNNKLDCVAKITKIINFNKADISYDTFNGDKVSIENHQFNNFSIINITKLNVIKEGYNEDIHKEVLDRINELKESINQNTLIPNRIATPYINPIYTSRDFTYTPNKSMEVEEPELFGNYPSDYFGSTVASSGNSIDKDENETMVEEFDAYIESLYNKLITGDILADETSVTASFINNMEVLYNKAFNNDKKAIKYWLDTFIDYLVCANPTIDVEVIAQALLDKLIGESVDNTITEIMIEILNTYI